MRDNSKRLEREQARIAAENYRQARDAYYYADYPASQDVARRKAFTAAREALLKASAIYFLGFESASISTAHAQMHARRAQVRRVSA